MRTTRESNLIWAACLGAVLAMVTATAAVWSGYKMYHLATWFVVCAGGFAFWFIGFTSIGDGAPASPHRKCGNTEKLHFEEFYLNGFLFRPYEEMTPNGRKQFRLSSTPELSAEREAAVIRYLINEGLSETIWPRVSKRIEEEASWAFFA